MSVSLRNLFLSESRGLTFADSSGVTWTFDAATNALSVAIASGAVGDFNEAVDDRVAVLLQSVGGITWTYNDGSNTLSPAVSLASFSTTDLSEGTNQYFTTERAQDAVGAALTDSSSIDFTYDDAGNTITAAVDQTFTPTWSGQHTFTASIGFVISAANPRFFWEETDQAADERFWGFAVNAKTIGLRTRNDAASASRDIFTASRGTGVAVASLSFGNATDNPEFSFLGTGNITFGATTTGAQTATFTATNKPGSGTAGPIAWIPVKTAAGTQGYVPIFGS